MPAPRGRDMESTRKRLGEWIAERLPGATDLRLEGLAGPGETGFSNDTLMFDLSYREGERDVSRGLVARIQPIGHTVFPEYDISRQFHVQRALRATDVPVAEMFWLEEDDGVLGAPFYVMERISGRIPTDTPPYHAGGWVTEISPEERGAIWWSGLDALTRIHRLDWRALGFDFLDQPERSDAPLDWQLDYYRDFLEWAARGRPQPTAEPGYEWLRANRPKSDEPVGLCWGDARIGNMIFDGGRCVAVLDWEMVTLGNPEQDLAWFLYLDRHHSEAVGVPRLPGFPSREETIAAYEERVGRRVRHLEYYEVFAAFRFAVIMIRLAQQMVSLGVLPADSQFETNNTATHLLARLLDLPEPGA